MKEMNIIVRGMLVTITAYMVVALLIFVYTDTNWIARGLGIAVCVVGHFVWMWFHMEQMFAYWIKKLGQK